MFNIENEIIIIKETTNDQNISYRFQIFNFRRQTSYKGGNVSETREM